VAHLTGVELEDMQHSSNAHLEEYCHSAAPKLHDVSELGAVEVLFWYRAEEVHSPAVCGDTSRHNR
jgi:hypothetical protein